MHERSLDRLSAPGEIAQHDRSYHERDRGRDGDFAEKARSSGAAEDSLTRASSEDRSDIRALAGLKKDDQDKRDTHDDMDDDNKRCKHSKLFP